MHSEQLLRAVHAEAEAEAARPAAVARYDILDTPPDGAFDRIARLAARLLRTPIGTVSIVDTDRSGSRPRAGCRASARSAATRGCARRRSWTTCSTSSATR